MSCDFYYREKESGGEKSEVLHTMYINNFELFIIRVSADNPHHKRLLKH